MAHYLVTGGAGFIGSHLVQALVQRGETVTVLDNLSSGKLSNLEPCIDKITFLHDDLRDLDATRKACQRQDYVLHQGALASVPGSIDDPLDNDRVNLGGTLNVLFAAREAGVRRVVYAASSAVYGDSPLLPKQEDMPPNPLSPYAVAKYSSELYCRLFTQLYGLETVSLRYFNVFGPRQDPTSQYAAVIPKFINAMLSGKAPVVFGNGEQSRDFVFISDVVEANLLACSSSSAVAKTINIASGRAISLNELVALLKKIIGSKLPPRYDTPRPGDILHSVADITLARNLLDFEPCASFEEGLRQTIAWFSARSNK